MHACMQACIFAWMHECMNACLHACTHARHMNYSETTHQDWCQQINQKPLLYQDGDSRYTNRTLEPKISHKKHCHELLFFKNIYQSLDKHTHHIGDRGEPKDLMIISWYFVLFIDWFLYLKAPCMALDLGTTQMHAYGHTYPHVHMCLSLHVHMYFCFHMCMYAYMHGCIYACENTFMYACLLTHTYIPTH